MSKIMIVVAHRLAVDYPNTVNRKVLLDFAQTLAMYEETSEQVIRSYWNWFFLIQLGSLPERLIQADPSA